MYNCHIEHDHIDQGRPFEGGLKRGERLFDRHLAVGAQHGQLVLLLFLLLSVKLVFNGLTIEDAFTRQLIGAPLEELEIFDSSGITDVTLDVLCQQLAASLRSLTLSTCVNVTGKVCNKASGEEDIDLPNHRIYFSYCYCFDLF